MDEKRRQKKKKKKKKCQKNVIIFFFRDTIWVTETWQLGKYYGMTETHWLIYFFFIFFLQFE